MLSLLLVIFIAIMIGGFILEEKSYHYDGVGFGMSVVGICATILTLIFLIFTMICFVDLKIIDQKITIYQEENTKIESQVETLVSQYQDYESGIFKDLQNESDVTLALSLYPELKADKLVTKQLNLYVKNNQKIKELKVEKLNEKIFKWWLYFGN